MRKVPHHGLLKWQQCETFYNGLEMTGKQLIDAYAGGDIGTKTPKEAYDLLEKVALKSNTQHTSRARTQRQGVHQVDGITSLAAQVEALSTKIDQMHVHKARSLCEFCGGAHPTSSCQVGDQGAHEQVDFMSNQNRPQNNPYSNTYNPGWRNHPNFSWKSGNNSQQPLGFTQLPPFQHQSHQSQGQSSQFRPQQGSFKAKVLAAVHHPHLRTIENKVGQIAKLLSKRPPDGLPSNTKPNPKAHVKAITLRSGRGTGPDPQVPVHESSEEEVAIEILDETPPRGKPASTLRPREPVRDYTPSVPYPGRLKKKKMEEQYGKFLGLFKQLHINLPFVEALAQMPKYARFLKDILTNKRKLEELSQLTLNEECSAVIQNKLPEKRRDPGSFTISCLIGSLSVSNALADLGASINVMPYAVFAKLELGEPTPTGMSIQLADRLVKYPRGIVENMLVKVDRFVFPVDFVILDMDEDKNIPIILGRPFLATAKALIDVYSGRLTLRVDEEEVTFDVRRSMQHTQNQDDSLYFVETIYSYCSTVFATVDRESEPIERPSIEDPSPVELKELPSHLEYAILDGESRLPVIIASDLTSDEKARLLEVLKQHKQAIAWRIMDIKGFNPSFCTHKILMEDDYKPAMQHQRRLNPNMQEVVKKEMIKLLDAGLIYPISDSPRDSPVQVFSKKGGMTVITKERNELIPTRTVTGWRVCIDYRKLNDATRKDHFPLSFIEQMLERLAGKMFYCFLDGFSGYFQIPIAPEDQEKTTFTSPYGTFAYRRMPFGLCNAPATFQRCMVAVFHDMIEDSMEVFFDDFSVFGSSFDHCLGNLERILARCEEANLMLNWEKCHFMVKEGILLGHKVSRAGIEVDRAKIDTISKLPPPTSVKSIRSFLGHAGFYRRFIKDFSKIARPTTQLLETEA
ncbi:hypothetical protein L1987_30416 [Smallanthus sonchifolius]|uniref:Uncharacterized protein n=1 Tax=Smallanthus sonchifolius TaxID=185202 RepID=A0ACB9I495_9ASTR|nr:hypothetical protein L1987_30416 [Smallanthus sonchifolius]